MPNFHCHPSGRANHFGLGRIVYRNVAIALVFAAIALTGCGSDKDKSTAPANDVATQTPPKSVEKSDAGDSPKPQTSEPTFDRPTIVAQSRDFAEKGDYQQAAAGLEKLLVADPDDLEVLFQLAVIKSRSGDLQAAVSLLSNIPEDHPQAGLPSLGQTADWCIQLE